jgi:hypothetical protein
MTTTTAATNPTLGSSIASFFKGLAGVIAADETGDIAPLLESATTNISKDPTLLNAAAQLSTVQVGIIGAQPEVAQEVLTATAGALNDLIQLAVVEVNAFKAANPLPAAATPAT